MSLLTPPRSSQKENHLRLAFSLSLNVDTAKMQASTSSTVSATPTSAARNVVWSPHNSIHTLGTPAKPIPSTASMNALMKERPVRSILKRRRTFADTTNTPGASTSKSPADVSSLCDLPDDLDQHFRTREATPEPAEPLQGNDYLAYPVSLIVKPDAQPREIVEGYSTLAARLRTGVAYQTDPDPSWPLFQPLREHREQFVECVIRDLGRARVDPIQTLACPSSDEEHAAMKAWASEEEKTQAVGGLPSPQRSPKKPRKQGMTAAQVKYARDLCTISHAALKLLCIMLGVPATYAVFEDKQLGKILNEVLHIPNAETLPTPNARKTCALAILVLQCQRLPERIVTPALTRIAAALKRGINSELGKEGKKGSANDGLKAIHDLCIYQPSVFIPAFGSGVFLRCVLNNLVAPTLALRVQACHALGGMAWALAGLTPSAIHHTVSEVVLEFITTPAPPSPSKSAKSTPTLPPRDSAIIRALRTTMGASDATHVAQSPIWGISVISNLILLLGSKMYTEKKACTTLLNVLKMGAKVKKASVKQLFTISWRCLLWAWFQPDYETVADSDDGEDEKSEEEEDGGSSYDRKMQREENKAKTREAYFNLLHEVLDWQTGLHAVIALLTFPPPSTANATSEDGLKRALAIMHTMVNPAAGWTSDSASDALQALKNMLFPSSTPSGSSSLTPSTRDILPVGLFSSHPTTGLLATDVSLAGAVAGSVTSAVRTLYEQLAVTMRLERITMVAPELLRRDWVWLRMCRVWRIMLGSLDIEERDDIPEDVKDIWERLVVCGLKGDEEPEDGEEVDELDSTEEEAIERVVMVLVGMLEDSTLDFGPKSDEGLAGPSPSTGKSKVPFPSTSDVFGSTTMVEVGGSAPGKATKFELKARVMRALFSIVRTVLSKEKLAGGPLEKLVGCLLNPKNVAEWTVPRGTGFAGSRKRTRTTTAGSLSSWIGSGSFSGSSTSMKDVWAPIAAWTNLVVSVMSVAEGDEAKEMMKAFWGLESTFVIANNKQRSAASSPHSSFVTSLDANIKSSVWKSCLNVWRKNEGCWEGAAVALAAPFACGARDENVWTLSSEETNRWKEVFEYVTGKALDYGVDGVSVVDCIAEAVLSAKGNSTTCGSNSLFSTPKATASPASRSASSSATVFAASLIQVSDLLLDHMDISDARDLPSALVSLVDETMRSVYPPAKKNQCSVTWMVQNLTRVIENCPDSLVGSLLEEWSDSLGVWLSDEGAVWSDEALDYTFLPLYEHIVLRVQSLPADLKFLERISGLLESVFSGAREMPEQMLVQSKERFEAFWKGSRYCDMEEPAGGWPRGIRRCLGLPVEEVVKDAEVAENEDEKENTVQVTLVQDEETSFTTDDELDTIVHAVPATPKRPLPMKRRLWAPRTPMANMNGMKHIPSPHRRPKKESVDASVPFPLPPASPVSPVRRRRRTSSTGSVSGPGLFPSAGPMSTGGLGVGLAPGLEVLESPSKRRRVSGGLGESAVGRNKENASPMRRARRESLGGSPVRVAAVASVAERIAATTDEVSEECEGEGRKKRRRMKDKMGVKKAATLRKEVIREVSPADSVDSVSSCRSGGSTSSDDERFIADRLIPFPGKAASDDEEETISLVKKRKRTSLDGPSNVSGDIQVGRRRKLEHVVETDEKPAALPLSRPPQSKKTPEPADPVAMIFSLLAKRKTPAVNVDEAEDPFEVEASSTAPLPALRLSKKRVAARAAPPSPPPPAAPAPVVVEEEDEEPPLPAPSTDDDPHYGQVTPHHIVSPSLVQKSGKVYTSKAKRLSALDVHGGRASFGEAMGSDDDPAMQGDVGSSPLKNMAERRMLKRQNSLNGSVV